VWIEPQQPGTIKIGRVEVQLRSPREREAGG
jgi:hypothetical protein